MSKRGGKAKKGHKGQHRHFITAEEVKAAEEAEKRDKEWKRRQGLESDDEDGTAQARAPGDLPPSDSSDSDSGEEVEGKPKGVSHLIEGAIFNPNRVKEKSIKAKNLTLDAMDTRGPSRKEREEIEKLQAKERYMKLKLKGQTEEARADLARLALIRKEREDAAKRREQEKKEKETKKT